MSSNPEPPDDDPLGIPEAASSGSAHSGSDAGVDRLPPMFPPAGNAAAGQDGEQDPNDSRFWPEIDGYVLNGYLGGGGFGSVYRALRTKHDSTVAIKILKPEGLEDTNAERRFSQEVRTAAQNPHMHVVQVIDSGAVSGARFAGCPYVVLEYLPGGNFGDWLKAHPRQAKDDQNLRLAVEKLLQVCSGLQSLHDAGILHRDIKPANILLDREGNPKLADFGLAGFFDPCPSDGRAKSPESPAQEPLPRRSAHPRITRAGEVFGTIGYMAPELFRGAEFAGPQSDQYAIGVILYQILCNLRPFQSRPKDPEESERIRRDSTQRPQPPSSKSSFLDRDLQRICLRCLEPDPQDRYPSIEKLMTHLSQWLAGEEITWDVDPRPIRLYKKAKQLIRRKPFRFLGMVAAVLLVISGCYGIWYRLAYVRPYVSWYNDIIERRGVFEGIQPLALAVVRQRDQSYRITTRGWYGPIQVVERINGYEQLVQVPKSYNDMWGTEFAADYLNASHREVRYEYQYAVDGRVTQVLAFNHRQLPLWKKTFTSPEEAMYQVFVQPRRDAETASSLLRRLIPVQSVRGAGGLGEGGGVGGGDVSSPSGISLEQLESSPKTGQSLATVVRYRWSAEGLKLAAVFADDDNKPQQNADGVFGYRDEHDSLGRITSRTFLDNEGNPIRNRAGVATAEIVYGSEGLRLLFFDEKRQRTLRNDDFTSAWMVACDAAGREVSVRFFDTQDNPTLHAEGYHGWTAEYDSCGNNTVLTFMDVSGLPVLAGSVAAITRIAYDYQGRQRSIRYYAADNSPVNNNYGRHEERMEYDGRGNRTVMAFFGVDAAPTSTKDGYALERCTYDKFGNMTSVRLFDIAGKPTTNGEGVHGQYFEYDNRGNQTVVRCIGTDGNAVYNMAGYAVERSIYDEFGRVQSVRLYDTKNNPADHTDGYHGWVSVHDDRGHETLRRYIASDGTPRNLKEGYATTQNAYDEYGRQISQRYFDAEGKPAADSDGVHGWDAEYDNRGHEILRRFINTDGRLTMNSVGYASIRKICDELGRVLSVRYSDDSGLAVTDSEGVHGWNAEYDGRGNETLRTYIGVDGGPTFINSGYVTMRSRRDAYRRLISVRYFDASDSPVTNNEGVHGWNAEYDGSGNEMLRRYIGVDDNPTFISGGYVTIRRRHDAYGRLLSLRYFDASGNPATNSEGVHGWNAEYDGRGNETLRTSIGSDGSPAMIRLGYATVSATHDAYGRMVRARYFDTAGNPVPDRTGVHGWNAEYDSRGNEAIRRFVGTDGRSTINDDGYAEYRSTCNLYGAVISMRYFDADGKPTTHVDGYHGWDAEYDSRGNETLRRHISTDGEATETNRGYSVRRKTIDQHGRLLALKYYNAADQAVIYEIGSHGWEAEYDHRGRQTLRRYIGVDGDGVVTEEGYAIGRQTFDDYGRVRSVRFFDAAGQAVATDDGVHGWNADFDIRGNEILRTFIDVNGNPAMSSRRFASTRQTFNGMGQVLTVRYFDTNDQPVTHVDGNHGFDSEYDQRGNETLHRFVGTDGKPTVTGEGYASSRQTFDRFGRLLSVRCFNINDEATTHVEGYHGWEVEYDSRGNKTRMRYFNVDESPAVVVGGYSQEVATYDERGRQTSRRIFGPDGSAVDRRPGFGAHAWAKTFAGDGSGFTVQYMNRFNSPVSPAGVGFAAAVGDSRGGVRFFGGEGRPSGATARLPAAEILVKTAREKPAELAELLKPNLTVEEIFATARELGEVEFASREDFETVRSAFREVLVSRGHPAAFVFARLEHDNSSSGDFVLTDVALVEEHSLLIDLTNQEVRLFGGDDKPEQLLSSTNSVTLFLPRPDGSKWLVYSDPAQNVIDLRLRRVLLVTYVDQDGQRQQRWCEGVLTLDLKQSVFIVCDKENKSGGRFLQASNHHLRLE